jgi:outer membrane protein assembly factor BamB
MRHALWRESRANLSVTSLVALTIMSLASCSFGATSAPPKPSAPLPAVILSSLEQSSPQSSAGYATLHLEALDPTDGSIRWRYQALTNPLRQQGAPVVVGGVVYIISDDLPTTATGTTLPDEELTALDERDGHTLWKVKLTGLGAKPVVSDGVIYTSGMSFNSARQLVTSFYALRADSGKQLWRTDITNAATSTASAPLDQQFGFADSIQVVNGAEYVTSNTYCETICSAQYLLALRASDGKRLWKTTVYTSGTIQPPLVAGAALYVDVAGAYNEATNTMGPNELVAYNASDGSIRWKTPLGAYGPLYMAHGLIYTNTSARDNPNSPNDWTYTLRVVALDAASGATRWSYIASSKSDDAPTPLLAVSADTVYAQSTTTTNGVAAHTLDGLDPTSGAVRWRAPLARALGAMTLDGATLYTITDPPQGLSGPSGQKASIMALPASGGQPTWSTPLTPAPRGDMPAVYLMAHDATLYALYYSSTLNVFDAQSGAVRWTATVPGALVGVTLAP